MPPKRPTQFDTLLRIRQRQEDLYAAALATARRDVQRAEQQRDAITQAQQLMLEKAVQRAQALFDPREIRTYYQYERHLQRLVDMRDAEIRKLKKVAEERRQELEEAMKRRRIIEKLIERKMHTYHEEIRKEEQHQADEVSSNYASLVGHERLIRGGGPTIAATVVEATDMAMEN